MGTRNLTMVVLDGKTRIAQYGQWDGYPSGQGAVALDFLLTADLEAFKVNLLKCKFMTKGKEREIKKFLKSIGTENGWMDGDQAAKYHAKYPLLTRDNGAEILSLVYQGLKGKERCIWLQDSESFAGDSLFCEWAYVIDFDKRTFEVYEGFNKTELTEDDRFFKFKDTKSEYWPVKLLKSYSLDELPSETDFIKELEGKEKEA